MSKLLKANIMQLVRGKVFIICVSLCAANSIYIFIDDHFDLGFTFGNLFLPLVSAILTLMYANGERDFMTNRIVKGFSKTEVYLSIFITCELATLFMGLIMPPYYFPRRLSSVGLVPTLIVDRLGSLMICAICVWFALVVREKTTSVVLAATLMVGFFYLDEVCRNFASPSKPVVLRVVSCVLRFINPFSIIDRSYLFITKYDWSDYYEEMKITKFDDALLFIVPILTIAALVFLGARAFERKDLK